MNPPWFLYWTVTRTRSSNFNQHLRQFTNNFSPSKRNSNKCAKRIKDLGAELGSWIRSWWKCTGGKGIRKCRQILGRLYCSRLIRNRRCWSMRMGSFRGIIRSIKGRLRGWKGSWRIWRPSMKIQGVSLELLRLN